MSAALGESTNRAPRRAAAAKAVESGYDFDDSDEDETVFVAKAAATSRTLSRIASRTASASSAEANVYDDIDSGEKPATKTPATIKKQPRSRDKAMQTPGNTTASSKFIKMRPTTTKKASITARTTTAKKPNPSRPKINGTTKKRQRTKALGPEVESTQHPPQRSLSAEEQLARAMQDASAHVQREKVRKQAAMLKVREERQQKKQQKEEEAAGRSNRRNSGARRRQQLTAAQAQQADLALEQDMDAMDDEVGAMDLTTASSAVTSGMDVYGDTCLLAQKRAPRPGYVAVKEPKEETLGMLAAEGLDHYGVVVLDEGYKFVEDLVEAEEDDLQGLITAAGMKKPEGKRFLRAVAARKTLAAAGGGEQMSSKAPVEVPTTSPVRGRQRIMPRQSRGLRRSMARAQQLISDSEDEDDHPDPQELMDELIAASEPEEVPPFEEPSPLPDDAPADERSPVPVVVPAASPEPPVPTPAPATTKKATPKSAKKKKQEIKSSQPPQRSMRARKPVSYKEPTSVVEAAPEEESALARTNKYLKYKQKVAKEEEKQAINAAENMNAAANASSSSLDASMTVQIQSRHWVGRRVLVDDPFITSSFDGTVMQTNLRSCTG